MVIGLLGAGTVGGGVHNLISGRTDMRIKTICCLESPEGLSARLTTRAADLFEDPEIDVVVEVMGGLHPAREFVIAAMEAGKHVVTANKLLVAECYEELIRLAAEKQVAFRCTAAAGGGIPWLTALERCKRVDTITSVSGIMNGTTNYIMDTMHKQDVSFADVLGQAQQLGYAEADPSADIDGSDIQNKLVISANVAFDVLLKKEDVPVFGIRTVTAEDIATIKAEGLRCKLLARAARSSGKIAAYVEPTLVDRERMEAAVPSNYNLISFRGANAGKQSYYGQGAGRYPTAYNVVEDLVDLSCGVRKFYTTVMRQATVDNDMVTHQYYVRTSKKDPWLKKRTVRRWATGVVTDTVPVGQMHAWARQMLEKDPQLFIAAIR
mgnify:CR=1 FL=1